MSVVPDQLLADGYDSAALTIESDAAPRVSVTGPATVEEHRGQWQVRAGVLPGRVVLRAGAAKVELTTYLNTADRFEDGTPDFLRLDEEQDRQSFRQWFTYLAEEAGQPSEINDCAALIRYAYREALKLHDTAWAADARLPLVPAFGSIRKYRYPYTPLKAALFRVKEGPFRPADLEDGAFSQFADAQTLCRLNSFRIGRDFSRALPGDLLFFRQDEAHVTFHSMIFLDGRRVIYHTGPEGDDPGELRRLSLEELLRFPQPEWRPLASNPAFLGVYRWNILKNDANR